MKLNWKVLRVAILLSCVALGSGCGGVSASHSVSPASILLPGLIQHHPSEKLKEQASKPMVMVDQVSSSAVN